MAEEQKWPAAKVRETFLKFFEGKEHTIGTYRQTSRPLAPLSHATPPADSPAQCPPPPSALSTTRLSSSPMLA
jgi:hypothetical protein